jgi:hypothetical protein
VKFNPANKCVVGQVLITKRKPSEIKLQEDVTKNVTKFILVEEVSPEAEAAGYAPGDLVLPRAMEHIFLKGGEMFRASCSIDVVISKPTGWSLDDFMDWRGRPFNATAENESAA